MQVIRPKHNGQKTAQRAKETVHRVSRLLTTEIWESRFLGEKSLRGFLFLFLRILSLIIDGVRKNRIPSQAAALSYYSLIALGPLIAIVIMVSGFVLRDNQDLAVNTLTKIVYFIAPTAETASENELNHFFDGIDDTTLTDENAEDLAERRPQPNINPTLVDFIATVVRNAQSGTVGIVGSLILILISIRLLSSIENTYNTIWGVRRGRSIIQSIVFFWTLLSLGAVAGFASLTINVYGKLAQVFERLPWGSFFRDGFLWMAPVISFGLLICLLAVFNRFIPNTTVRWGPAFWGALVVTLLLYLNQNLTFLYIGQVIRQQSLFGSVGILPVLLFGLYIFWLFLLLGGQISYSIQNVNHLTHQRAWDNVSVRTQENLCLATLLLISRRFLHCEPPYSADELSNILRAPVHIINRSLLLLMDMGYINPVEPRNTGTQDDETRYQPSRPLDSITLANFKEQFERHGNNDADCLLKDADPLLEHYQRVLLDYANHEGCNQPLDELLKQS